MTRAFWEHLLVPVALAVLVALCNGGAGLVRAWLDVLGPQLGTRLGLFVCSACGAFYLVALVGIARSRGRSMSAGWVFGAVLAAPAGGIAATWIVMSRYRGGSVEHYGGLIGIGLLILALVVIPINILARRPPRAPETDQEREQRLRSATARASAPQPPGA